MRRAFPQGTTPRDTIKAIKEKHAPTAHLFERGHGLRFMKTESDLIVAVMLRLMKHGVVALPIHDAVAVRRRDAERAKVLMQAEARSLTGGEIPVEIQSRA